ncbi:MAG: cysteine desulfurase NifS [Elusimicrobiota bacterium]
MGNIKKVYVDNNATTPVDSEVLSAMEPYYKEIFGNPSSIHAWGREAKKAIEDARCYIASVIGALPEEIYFTGSGTEADNWAVKGIVNAQTGDVKPHIITSKIEHHAVLSVVNYLERKGFEAGYISVDNKGVVDLGELKNSIRQNTVLVSVMYANNEVGTIEPVEKIGALIKEVNELRKSGGQKKIYFHTDAVQVLGKIPIDVNLLNVDLLSMSAHKIYGPKGIGALYIRKGTKIEPMFHGGHHERAKRAGTENVAGIAGFAAALKLCIDNISEEEQKLRKLKKKLFEGLQKNIDEVYLNGDLNNSLPGALSVSFNYVEGESIIMMLDMKGVAVSSGSACTSGSLESSHVLKAMHVDVVLAQGSIRFSFGRFNTEEDVDYILEVLPPIIERLRNMSPLYKKK